MAPTTCLLTKKTKILQICITCITLLLSFAISRCPNDRNYVGPFGQSVYRSGRTDGTRLPLHVACFQHFVQWQFATGHFHHFGSGSLRHVLRYLFIYYYFQNVQNQIVTF